MTLMATASDREGELVERGCDAELFAERLDAEFVLPAPKVLQERVPSDHHACRPVGLHTAHWSTVTPRSARSSSTSR